MADTENNPDPEQENVSQSSQASQSATIVTVPRGADHAPADARARAVVAKIDAILEANLDVLMNQGDSLTIPYRRSKDPPGRPIRALKFPGRTLHEATRFGTPACHLIQMSVVPSSPLMLSSRRQPR